MVLSWSHQHTTARPVRLQYGGGGWPSAGGWNLALLVTSA